jgi:hypothetical protein
MQRVVAIRTPAQAQAAEPRVNPYFDGHFGRLRTPWMENDLLAATAAVLIAGGGAPGRPSAA